MYMERLFFIFNLESAWGHKKSTPMALEYFTNQYFLTISELLGCFVISLSTDLISFCLNRCFSAFFLAPVFFFGISAFLYQPLPLNSWCYFSITHGRRIRQQQHKFSFASVINMAAQEFNLIHVTSNNHLLQEIKKTSKRLIVLYFTATW